MWRTLMVAVAVAFMLTQAQAHPAIAQQPPPPPTATPAAAPVRPGDVLWTFAQEPPFFDSRVALALATLIYKDQSTSAPGTRIYYAEYRVPEPPRAYVGVSPAPIGDVTKLLAAAGFPGGLHELRVTGRCKIWSAPPPVGVTPAVQPGEAADLVGRLLVAALAEAGRPTQACVATPTMEDAHVLVWVEGGPPPAIPRRQQSTFLSLPLPQPGQQPGRGGGIPLPARTGSGAGTAPENAFGVILAVALLSGATAVAVLPRRRSSKP